MLAVGGMAAETPAPGSTRFLAWRGPAAATCVADWPMMSRASGGATDSAGLESSAVPIGGGRSDRLVAFRKMLAFSPSLT